VLPFESFHTEESGLPFENFINPVERNSNIAPILGGPHVCCHTEKVVLHDHVLQVLCSSLKLSTDHLPELFFARYGSIAVFTDTWKLILILNVDFKMLKLVSIIGRQLPFIRLLKELD